MIKNKIVSIIVALSFMLVAVMMFQPAVYAAAPQITLQKTNNAPLIDGKLDNDIYVKLHDFYAVDGFHLGNDPNKEIKGETYATWDDKCFYAFTIVHAENHEVGVAPAIDMGYGTVGYAALIATEPEGSWTDDMRVELGCGVTNEGEQQWKTCSPADIKDSSDDLLIYKTQPFQSFSLRDETNKLTYYEFAIPWSLVDRTNTISFTEGHKITYNYSYTVHTYDEYIASNMQAVEMGGGIWNGSYSDGMVITLGAAPVSETTAAPETQQTEALSTPATAPAAQTFDPFFALTAIVSIAGSAAVIVYKSKKQQK